MLDEAFDVVDPDADDARRAGPVEVDDGEMRVGASGPFPMPRDLRGVDEKRTVDVGDHRPLNQFTILIADLIDCSLSITSSIK